MIRGLLLLAVIALSAGAAGAGEVVARGDGVIATAREAAKATLTVDLRVEPPFAIDSVKATVDGQHAPASDPRPYPSAGDVSAILFLVDTSDPARQKIVEQNGRDIAAMMRRAGEYHQFGLAHFDRTMEILAPMGASAEALATAGGRLKAAGQITLLFQSIIEAIEAVAKYPARRRAVVVLSDGRPEDKDYTRDHVIESANKNGVAVFGLGYAMSVREERNQKLRQMAKETGGTFAKTDSALRLPPSFLADPFAALDAGAAVTVDLAAARSWGGARAGILRLVLSGADGERAVDIPITIPEAGLVQVLARPAVGLPVAIVIIVIFGIGGGWWRRRPPPPGALGKPHAVLEFLDGDEPRQSMRDTALTIGRSKDDTEKPNDVELDNKTVSEHHALIRRLREGTYTITDLESTNGTLINGQAVTTGPLADGDIVELGKVHFRFVVLAEPEDGTAPKAAEPTAAAAPLTTGTGPSSQDTGPASSDQPATALQVGPRGDGD